MSSRILSLRPLILLLSLLHVLAVVSTPLPEEALAHLDRRTGEALIGYRYVDATKAAEYNKAKTLTNVPASGTQLGQGAYLSPALGQWSVPANYWKCQIMADPTKFKAAPKFFINDETDFYSQSKTEATLKKAGLSVEKTILFSKISGDTAGHIQMLIPPYYLAASASAKKSGGSGSSALGLSVTCVEQSANLQINSEANWEQTWAIPGWPCGVNARDLDGRAAKCTPTSSAKTSATSTHKPTGTATKKPSTTATKPKTKSKLL